MTPSDSSFAVLPVPISEARAGDDAAARQHGRQLLEAFARTASSAFNLPAGLAVLCHSAAKVFGAARVGAWLHDRRARELVLAAGSDASGAAEGARIRVDSELLPAIALRRDRALRLDAGPGGSPNLIALPLRGRRRALGVLVLEGLPTEENAGVVADLEDLARQLSASIENLLLLEDVLRSRRELAQTFDSLEDLVAICDARLHIVYVNRTLSDRFAHPHDRLFDRPLVELVGEDARDWLSSLPFNASRAHAPATYAKELDDEVLGGRFTMTLTPVLGADLGGHRAVFVARDITKQARLEAERRELLHRLAQAEQQAAASEVARRIARRLQSPLKTVAERAASLGAEKKAPPRMRKEAAALARDAARTLGLVEELLAAAGGKAERVRSKPSRA